MLRTSHVRHMPSPRTPPRRSASPHPPHTRQDSLSPSSTFRLAPLILSLILGLAGVGVYMWPRVQVIRLAYQLQSSEQRLKELLQERDQLQVELAALKDPQRVYRIATEQLGMRAPGHAQRVLVTPESKDQ